MVEVEFFMAGMTREGLVDWFLFALWEIRSALGREWF
jgi:hypothetical protein